MRDQNRANPAPVLNDFFAFKALNNVTATIDGHPYVSTGQLVSGNFFSQLEVVHALGRAIQPTDDATPGSGAVTVISYGLSSRVFGRSPAVIGKTMQLNLIPVTIFGVAPEGFTGTSSAQQGHCSSSVRSFSR